MRKLCREEKDVVGQEKLVECMVVGDGVAEVAGSVDISI